VQIIQIQNPPDLTRFISDCCRLYSVDFDLISSMPLPLRTIKPDLRHLETRSVPIGTDLGRLRTHLMPWMMEVVKSTGQPHNMRGMPTWKFLVNMASGVDGLLGARGMSLGKGDVPVTVFARFDLSGQANGSWMLQHVTFSLTKDGPERDKEREKAELKARLLAEAEARNRLHPKASAFKVALHVDTWIDDIKAGATLLQKDLQAVYEYAAKAASIPDNPIGVKDVVMSGVGAGVGKLGQAGDRAKKLADQYGKIDTAISHGEKAVKYGAMIKGGGPPEDIFQQSQSKIYKTDKGDIVADEVIDYAAGLPGAGPFIKGFAGMFFHFASMNYAGAVAKARGRCYSWFIAGYVQGLINVGIDSPPSDPLDSFFFKFGMDRTMRDNEKDKFRVQIFLLWYSKEHHLIGTTSPGVRMERPLDWTFPDGYLAFWSPERLASGIATLIRTTQYLVD